MEVNKFEMDNGEEDSEKSEMMMWIMGGREEGRERGKLEGK